MAIPVVYTICGLSLFSGNMADLVHLQHLDQCHGVNPEDGQYGIASIVRSSSVNVRGEHKATLFQGYQGNIISIGRKVGDLHKHTKYTHSYVNDYFRSTSIVRYVLIMFVYLYLYYLLLLFLLLLHRIPLRPF